jgi:TolB-like protein
LNASPDIFLSYNREDQAVAKRFADAFAAEGLNVWWDQTLRSGEAYDEVTEAALRAAKAVVVLWSPRSVVSRWVRAEATIADRCKALMPVMIEACERPIMFELTQTAELSHWTGDAADKDWRAFLADVLCFVGREARSVATSVAAASESSANAFESFIPALAILPIATRLGDADEDAGFAADLTDELLTALSAISLLRILPGAMSSVWQARLTDLRPVARDLGARYLLDGNLRRTGDGFRVAFKMVEGESGKVLWSEKFGGPLSDLGNLPDALANEIARYTDDRFSWLEYEQAARKTHGLNAWDHLNRSIRGAIDTTSASLRLAIGDARKALDMAPGWGMAHACLGYVLTLWTLFGGGSMDGTIAAEARKHLNAALDADKNSAPVFVLTGSACNYLGDPADGLRMLERARALNPHHIAVHLHLMVSNMLLGRLSEALAECDRQIETTTSEMANQWVFLYRSAIHFLGGENDLAARAAERSLHFNPNGDTALIWQVALAAMLGADGQARFYLAKFRTLEPEFTLENCLDYASWTLMADEAKADEARAAFARIWAEGEA